MRYLVSLILVAFLTVVAPAGGSAVADSHEMPGYDAKHLRLQIKAGGHIDVQGPLRCRGGVFLFRINGQLVSLPSNQVEKVTPIVKPVAVPQPAKVTPPVDPSAPAQLYELRGDQADPAADPGSEATPSPDAGKAAPDAENGEAAPAEEDEISWRARAEQLRQEKLAAEHDLVLAARAAQGGPRLNRVNRLPRVNQVNRLNPDDWDELQLWSRQTRTGAHRRLAEIDERWSRLREEALAAGVPGYWVN